MNKLILASTSKYRRQLLSQLQWDFEAVAPNVEEDNFKNIGLNPTELALKLSELKAKDVLARYPDYTVIGSDQVCSYQDEIFSKPENAENAFKQLRKMSGQTHQLITAVTIASVNHTETWANSTQLTMRDLTDEEIRRYITIDNPLDCAGSYKLESMGIKLFSKIEMSDHTSIIGLPLIDITNNLINKFGFKF